MIEFGKLARQTVPRGPFVCSFQYVNEEPAACFFPRYRKVSSAGAFIVCLSAAYKYVGHTREEQEFLVEQAVKACEVMGFTPAARSEVIQMATFINDMLVDLIKMKPFPESERKKFELDDFKQDGNRIHMVVH